MVRALVIALAIVTAQWALINRFPEPRWVLLTLAVPALFVGLTLSGVKALVGRRGGVRR
jgi:hypothetical protein